MMQHPGFHGTLKTGLIDRGDVRFPAQDQEFILSHSDNVESSGFVQHLKLPHYVDFQSELVFARHQKKSRSPQKEAFVGTSI